MKKRIIVGFSMILVCMFVFVSQNFASSAEINEENLKEAFLKYMKSEEVGNADVEIKDNLIKFKLEDQEYSFNYQLGEKPTFSKVISLKKGMSYDEFDEKNSEVLIPMIGYIGALDVQGISFEDSMSYFMMSYLKNALSSSAANSYELNNDIIQFKDGKSIPKSEFGDYVLEIVDLLYGTKIVIQDNGEGEYNTFSCTIEEENKTQDSCDLVCTIVLNMDADFSKINGYSKSDDIKQSSIDILSKLFGETGTTLENNDKKTSDDDNNKENTNGVEENNNVESKNEVSNMTTMPKTGKETNPILVFAYVSIIISFIGIFALIVTSKSKKNNT